MTVATRSAQLTAVEKTAFRVSLLMRAATHPDKMAIGTWSVAETANHLSHCYPSFMDALRGTPLGLPEEVDPHNTEVLAGDPERDLDVLADRVEAGMRGYVEAAAACGEDDLVEFFTGVRVPASGVTAALLGEALVHGYDIAKAEGLPWLIEPEHAILIVDGLEPVMVHFVDEEACADLEAVFEIQLRGGPTRYWHFDEGRLTIESAALLPVDCHISAEPVPWMLMSYNRIGPTMPVLTGKLRVGGRRPWLATRLGGVFKT